MAIDEDDMAQAEAIYCSVLASLDELDTYEASRLAALNWAKYVMLGEAAARHGLTPETHEAMLTELTTLCLDFAERVLQLPMRYAEHMDKLRQAEACGLCPECMAAGIGPSERPTEPAPRAALGPDETVN